MLRTLRSVVPVVLLAAAAALPAPALAATPTGGLRPTSDLSIRLGTCRVDGITRPNTAFRLTHRSAAGAVRSKVQITSDDLGEWRRPCPAPAVAVGDRIELRLIGDPLPFKSFTVPGLTLVTDRVNNKIRGTAKGVAQVGLSVATCDAGRTICAKGPNTVAAVDPDTHAFSWVVPADLTGLSQVSMYWELGEDEVLVEQDMAHLVVQLGSPTVRVTGPARGVVKSLSLRRGTAVTTVSRKTGILATYTAKLKRDGSPVKVRSGDRITSNIAADAAFTVPSLTANLTAGGATGTCFKSRSYTVTVRDAEGAFRVGGSGLTNARGRWELGAAISAGWVLTVECANAAGDIVVLRRVFN